LPTEDGVRGGVTGGDNGDFGLPCAGSDGDDGREHVSDIDTGLDGGFAGIGRDATFPFEEDFGPDVGFPRRGCGCERLLSFLEGPGGVGGRSPESSYENEVFVWVMVSNKHIDESHGDCVSYILKGN